MAARPRVALIADFAEERWPSMDLVADSLAAQLRCNHHDEISVTLVRPSFCTRLRRVSTGHLANLDRLINRFVDYPRRLRRLRHDFDLFHIIDHSYAHLVQVLPPALTLVTCHDLETFRCLLTPNLERRSPLFRAMARRILSGFQRAALVSCVSHATRDAVIETRIRDASSCVVIPNGVSPIFTTAAHPADEAAAARLLGAPGATLELLSVGSAVPRKRLDHLLRVFAELRPTRPDLRLIRVGGALPAPHLQLARELALNGAIVSLPSLSAGVLAAIYRRAALLLLPSEREGFGLPLLESLACGTPVLASAIPALSEVGGDAACYAPAGGLGLWIDAAQRLLDERADDRAGWDARRARGVARARGFSWDATAAQTVALYRRLLN